VWSIKIAGTCAVELQAVTPNSVEEVRFAIGSQDGIALDFVGTIGKLIEWQG
jgi:hypothetical protein